MTNNTKGIKIYHVNTRSICRKVSQLHVLYSEADFLGCSETWLDNRITNSIIDIPGMTCFRKDRKSNIQDYKIHIIGGGACLYVANKWRDFTVVLDYGTKISTDFEILTIEVNKPHHKKMIISVIYKPPKGKIEKCITVLKEILSRFENRSEEVWILGDLNVDYLKRDCPKTVLLNDFLRKAGLKQQIHDITRPNKSGGTCIDYILTNSSFVEKAGVTNDLLADHYTIYCIRKKSREFFDKEFKTVRDYSRYNKDEFTNLIINSDWSEYDLLLDPNLQWEILLSNVLNVLSIMCPYKRVFARKEIVPWLTPEIYKALQDKKNSIKKYRDSKSSGDLTLAKIARNKANMLIEKAKRTFIKNSLKINGKNPKKFWRIINDMIKNGNLVNIENITFVNQDSHEPVLKSNVPDFLNLFFANIAENTRLFNESNVPDLVPNMYRENMFEFLPPSIHEIKDLAGQIDT